MQSCVLALNNIRAILVFGAFNILVNIGLFFVVVVISGIISTIEPTVGILIQQFLMQIGSCLLLIWFVSFYIKLSNTK